MRRVAAINRYFDMVCSEDSDIRRHADGTKCEAKSEETCPFSQKAEHSDIAIGETKKAKREESRRAIGMAYGNLVRSDFSPDAMKTVFNVDEKIERGELAPLRMPENSMRKDSGLEMPRWARSLYHMLAFRDRSNMRMGINDVDFIMKFAKASGRWNNNITELCRKQLGDPFASGEEADCYDGKTSVIKTFSDGITPDMMTSLERIMLGNHYFPESRYDTRTASANPGIFSPGDKRAW